jgi:hypothetical protein
MKNMGKCQGGTAITNYEFERPRKKKKGFKRTYLQAQDQEFNKIS